MEYNLEKFTLITRPLPPNEYNYRVKSSHTCSGRLRFNLFINLFIICFVGLPLVIPLTYTLALNLLFCMVWLIIIVVAARSQVKIYKNLKKSKEKIRDLHHQKFKQLMCTFVYKEPIELILKTLENISNIKMSEEIILAVCLEERTPEKEKKIEHIRKFASKFSHLIITVHTLNEENEIPGKCSNYNYALRSIVGLLKLEDPEFNPEEYFVTNFDIDTIFHKKFLEFLNSTIFEEKCKHEVVWQSLLYYNWDLDKLSFFTRITGLVRNIMMMGALVPLNINIMSVYTSSLKLNIEGNYCHPLYQMEDIICYIRWMLITKKKLTIKAIYCPTISGPTSGTHIFEEASEWARQIRRWTIGSAEVFHYFCVKAKRIKFIDAFHWALIYFIFYGLIMCGHALMSITTMIGVFTSSTDEFLKIAFLCPMILTYLCFIFIFILNKIAVKTILKEVGVKENIGLHRDVIEIILSPLVMICYSFVAFYGFMEVFIRGKKVCKHGASKKENLKSNEKRPSKPIILNKI